jgi:hypothetical protein
MCTGGGSCTILEQRVPVIQIHFIGCMDPLASPQCAALPTAWFPCASMLVTVTWSPPEKLCTWRSVHVAFNGGYHVPFYGFGFAVAAALLSTTLLRGGQRSA